MSGSRLEMACAMKVATPKSSDLMGETVILSAQGIWSETVACNPLCNTKEFNFNGGDCDPKREKSQIVDCNCNPICYSKLFNWDKGDCDFY